MWKIAILFIIAVMVVSGCTSQPLPADQAGDEQITQNDAQIAIEKEIESIPDDSGSVEDELTGGLLVQ